MASYFQTTDQMYMAMAGSALFAYYLATPPLNRKSPKTIATMITPEVPATPTNTIAHVVHGTEYGYQRERPEESDPGTASKVGGL